MSSPFLDAQQQQAPPQIQAPAATQVPAPAVAAPTEQAPQFMAASGVVGNPQDDLRRAEAVDPTEVEQPTDEEQQQYDDFVTRAIALISDNRKPEGGGKSPSEATIDMMNNSSFTVPEALAEGAANTVMLLHNVAKRANKSYTPDVIFHGADEVIAGLYLLGSAAGIFKDAPAHDWASKQDEEQTPEAVLDPGQAMAEAPGGQEVEHEEGNPSEADFTDEEYMLLGEAKILATENFGRKLQESGQLTEKEMGEAQDFWKSQIEKEVQSGQVDDSVMNRVDVESVRKQISKGGA